MSSIKLESNASGTGVFTIASPNSNTNRTLTLPDATGTIITTAGGAAISGTTGTFTGLVDISAAGAGQIQFPATQNASSGANTLDDYEEGTFTFTINAGGSNVVSGGGTFTGYYTKVGNLVTLQSGVIEINAKSAATGALTITGLPFTSAQQTAVPLCSLFNFSFADYPSARISSGVTTIDLHQTINAGTRSNLTDANILTSAYFVWFTSYRV